MAATSFTILGMDEGVDEMGRLGEEAEVRSGVAGESPGLLGRPELLGVCSVGVRSLSEEGGPPPLRGMEDRGSGARDAGSIFMETGFSLGVLTGDLGPGGGAGGAGAGFGRLGAAGGVGRERAGEAGAEEVGERAELDGELRDFWMGCVLATLARALGNGRTTAPGLGRNGFTSGVDADGGEEPRV